MEYLWLFLGALATICAVTFSVSVLVRYMAKSMPLSSPVFPVGGLILAAAYFFISVPVWMNVNLLYPTVGLLVLCTLLFTQFRLSGLIREIGFLITCGVSVLLIPQNLPLFKILGLEWTYLILALSLYTMMRLFMMMDRVPWFSGLTLMAQGILIMFLFQRDILPQNTGLPLFYAFVATIAISQTVKVYFGQPILGECAASIAGFVLGYLWTFVIAKGYWGLPPVLFSYSALEIGVSVFLSSIAARRITSPTMPYFVEQAFDTGLKTSRLIRVVFFVLVLLSSFSLANLSPDIHPEVFILLVIFLCTLCIQFKRWAVPRVRFRDLGSDLKQGMTDLTNEMMSLPLKKDAQKRKRSKK